MISLRYFEEGQQASSPYPGRTRPCHPPPPALLRVCWRFTVPVVPRSDIRQPADGPLPDKRREGTWRVKRLTAFRPGAAPRGHQGRCSCGRQPVLRAADASRDGAAAYAFQARCPSRRSSAKRTCGRARQALPPRHGPEGHATTTRRNRTPSLPQQHRVAERRSFGRCRSRARLEGPSVQPQSGRLLVAPSRAAHVATKDGRAPAGHQEISQCPTKCSSMRPIRRRPGWLFCAAIVSKNSTSNQPTVNSFAATSIWRR